MVALYGCVSRVELEFNDDSIPRRVDDNTAYDERTDTWYHITRSRVVIAGKRLETKSDPYALRAMLLPTYAIHYTVIVLLFRLYNNNTRDSDDFSETRFSYVCVYIEVEIRRVWITATRRTYTAAGPGKRDIPENRTRSPELLKNVFPRLAVDNYGHCHLKAAHVTIEQQRRMLTECWWNVQEQ